MSIVEFRKNVTDLLADAILKSNLPSDEQGESKAVEILKSLRERWMKMCLVHKVHLSTTFYDFMRYKNDPTLLTETDLQKIISTKFAFAQRLQTVDPFRKWGDIKADCKTIITELRLPNLLHDLLDEEKDTVSNFYDQEITKIMTDAFDPDDEKNELPVELFIPLKDILIELDDEDDEDDDEEEEEAYEHPVSHMTHTLLQTDH